MGHRLTDDQIADVARVARGEITGGGMRDEIVARARQSAPVTPLPGVADEETIELDGTESWLTTVDEPDGGP